MSIGVLSGLDLAVVFVSVLIVVVVGLLASRGAATTSDSYFLAGRSMPWWLIGTSFVATSISSEQIVGTVGITYEWGMGIANWEWFTLPVYTLLMVFFLPMLITSKITTIPEYFRRRFSPLCGDIYSWVMLATYILLFAVMILYSGGLAFSELTGWNFYVIVWLTVIIVGAYTVTGGMTSVMWTTMMQCIMLVGGGVVLFFVALNKIPGGWAAMVEANPERFHLYQPVDHPKAPFLGMIFASFGLFLFYQVGNQYMVQRILSARSTWDGLMAIILASFINILRPLCTCFLGLIVYHWIYEMKMAEPLENFDTAFPFALANFAPNWGLRGFIVAGFLAAILSTLSSLINSTATIFALDVYKRAVKHDQVEDAKVIKVAKIVAAASLGISALLAPMVAHLGGIFTFFQTGLSYIASPFLTTFAMGLLWKRTNAPGAVFGLVGGLTMQIAVALGLHYNGIELHFFYVAFIGQILTAIGIVVVSLLTEPPKESQLGSLIWSYKSLAVLGGDRHRPWYQQVKFWYAIFAVVWVCLYYTFW